MIEHWVQGERPARMRLDKAPWNREKLIKKGGTYALRLRWRAPGPGSASPRTGGCADAGRELLTGQAPYAAYFTTFFLTATTLVMAGLAREQVGNLYALRAVPERHVPTTTP